MKKAVSILVFLFLISLPAFAQENDVIFDSLMASYAAMNLIDLALTFELINNGGHEKNPLAKWYIEKPLLATAVVAFDNLIVYWGFKKLYKANKLVGILAMSAVILAKTYVIYCNIN